MQLGYRLEQLQAFLAFLHHRGYHVEGVPDQSSATFCIRNKALSFFVVFSFLTFDLIELLHSVWNESARGSLTSSMKALADCLSCFEMVGCEVQNQYPQRLKCEMNTCALPSFSLPFFPPSETFTSPRCRALARGGAVCAYRAHHASTLNAHISTSWFSYQSPVV